MPRDDAEPYWSTTDGQTVRLYRGDVREVLRGLPSRSVQCIVTSPPYWGLRDYGTGTWAGGDPECDHKRPLGDNSKSTLDTTGHSQSPDGKARSMTRQLTPYTSRCGKCGARRVDAQIGSEASPDCLGWARGENCAERDWNSGCHVCRMVLVCRELRRVLRDDGTFWMNYGDSYASGNTGGNIGGSIRPAGHTGDRHRMVGSSTKTGLPSGNLVGVPWRVAFALQADGWVLRQDIVWAKPSPMPESVRNRCTKAHEYVFLLTKGMRYFYDAEAIKEPAKSEYRDTDFLPNSVKDSYDLEGKTAATGASRNGRTGEVRATSSNKRSVWTISSQGYPGAHFATFPPKLIEPMILAGTSERGACGKCGAPWRRVVEASTNYAEFKESERDRKGGGMTSSRPEDNGLTRGSSNKSVTAETRTLGWEPTCTCGAGVVPCVVFDPFIGSGTTCAVALAHGRHSVGIDLSETYLKKNAVPRVEGELLARPALAGLVSRRKQAEGKTAAGKSILRKGA